MTAPKEKAQELVNRFMFAGIYFTDGIDGARKNAKQCALIAVDETLCILSDLCCDFGGNDIIEKEIAYWTEVKHELNKSE